MPGFTSNAHSEIHRGKALQQIRTVDVLHVSRRKCRDGTAPLSVWNWLSVSEYHLNCGGFQSWKGMPYDGRSPRLSTQS